MLHKDTFIIAPNTFKLIQDLQSISELQDFVLVGGTALALQIGHRNSIDIDLFSQQEFDSEYITEILMTDFLVEISYKKAKNTLLTYVNNIKTDFIRHNYNYVNPPIIEEGIRMLSSEDIAAMKLNAIINSGKRLKDFIDIYYLLERFTLNELLSFFIIKYPNMNPIIALKAVSYFDEIDPQIDPPKLRKKINLSSIKKRIDFAVLNPNKIF